MLIIRCFKVVKLGLILSLREAGNMTLGYDKDMTLGGRWIKKQVKH